MAGKVKHRVLVYGTLRKGGVNHAILGSSEYAGLEVVYGYRMITQGPWPYICAGEKKDHIIAEKYIADETILTLLDELEDFHDANSSGNLFERIEIRTDPGEKAWIYVISDITYNRIKNNCIEIPDGDWIKWVRLSSGYPDRR